MRPFSVSPWPCAGAEASTSADLERRGTGGRMGALRRSLKDSAEFVFVDPVGTGCFCHRSAGFVIDPSHSFRSSLTS